MVLVLITVFVGHARRTLDVPVLAVSGNAIVIYVYAIFAFAFAGAACVATTRSKLGRNLV